MKKKTDKLVIITVIIAIFVLLSWFVPEGIYQEGVFNNMEQIRVGIYDIFYSIISAFYYSFQDILYLFAIGGCYGVLCKTKIYRKLVDKVSEFVKGKEYVIFPIITLLMGAYVSISSSLILLFALVPFIVTIFLRNGHSRITAISAAMGGIFIGFLGLTYGTYGVSYLYESAELSYGFMHWTKLAFFIVAYVLYNLFALLYMRKTQKELEDEESELDETKYDPFLPEELDETGIKNKKRTKIWPIIVIGIITVLLCGVAYINWEDSFDISFFTNLHTSFTSAFKVADVPVFFTLLGETSFKGFGTYQDTLFAFFMIIITTMIISWIDKVKISEFYTYFTYGMRKVVKIVFIFAMVSSITYLFTVAPWPLTIVNKLFGSGSFNILVLLIISVVSSTLIGDFNYGGYMIGPYLALTFTERVSESILIWHVGQALFLVAAPTSALLMLALTYVDIPYKSWLSYIWKFLASVTLAILLILLIKIYM